MIVTQETVRNKLCEISYAEYDGFGLFFQAEPSGLSIVDNRM